MLENRTKDQTQICMITDRKRLSEPPGNLMMVDRDIFQPPPPCVMSVWVSGCFIWSVLLLCGVLALLPWSLCVAAQVMLEVWVDELLLRALLPLFSDHPGVWQARGPSQRDNKVRKSLCLILPVFDDPLCMLTLQLTALSESIQSTHGVEVETAQCFTAVCFRKLG